MQKVSVLSSWDIPPAITKVWRDLLAADASLDSPYFRPEFTDAVATVRDDVRVAIVEEGSEIVAVFPFQLGAGNAGRPVGGRLSDFQGIIGHQNLRISTREFVKKCGLSEWRFDHLHGNQKPFSGDIETRDTSPYIDLSKGYEAYIEDRRKQSSEIKSLGRKERKLEREVGEIRFTYHDADDRVFDQLVRWKADQYARTDLTNIFDFDWTLDLLLHILDRSDAEFQGVLSSMYAGDRLVAMHYGMASGGVLHSWFPAYDCELSKYSPGLISLQLLAEAAAENGIQRIDLGRGDETYKLKFASGTIPVCDGIVSCSPLRRAGKSAWELARRTAKTPALRPILSGPARMIRRMSEQAAMK
ncbi:GNAT family N-acetyltransferase [Stratiformator vulcanicus]|uniref:BioF2-like acetyltransferase domain-containing protein n=1 Tax=Stratiformator vulcanicus TaxID=2527980 RepID=A0A517QVQ3_9PLAN|nr:GNAT family N-acetyltransferase [Stratiformator vulcanicus]QDT35690.1 hypothetical protein Pan189_00430 [Stratiformator vulcanicus]